MIISNCSTSSTKKKCKSSNTKTRTPQELSELFSTQTSLVSLDYYFSVSKKAAGRGQRKVPAESAIGANFPLSSSEQPDISNLSMGRTLYLPTFFVWFLWVFHVVEIYQSHGLFGWVFLTGNPVISIIPSWSWICYYSCKEQNHKNYGMITNIKVVIYLWILLRNIYQPKYQLPEKVG